MRKSSASRIDLPHLTQDEVSERDHEETVLHREMSRCYKRDDFDEERADHVLRDSVVRIFRLGMAAYTKKPGYDPGWIDEIVHQSIYRVLKTTEDYLRGDINKHYLRLQKTALDDFRNNPIFAPPNLAEMHPTALTSRQASPLLLMAHAAAQLGAEAPSPASEKSLGKQIKQLREECRLTIEDLAAVLHVDRRSVVRHISGKNTPTKRHVAAYEKKFSESLGRAIRLKTSP